MVYMCSISKVEVRVVIIAPEGSDTRPNPCKGIPHPIYPGPADPKFRRQIEFPLILSVYGASSKDALFHRICIGFSARSSTYCEKGFIFGQCHLPSLAFRALYSISDNCSWTRAFAMSRTRSLLYCLSMNVGGIFRICRMPFCWKASSFLCVCSVQ